MARSPLKFNFAKPSSGDLLAGVSVALLALPQGLAYAELAGIPAKYGLYAAAFPSILAAMFASSPYLQTGPVALTALLTYGALEGLAHSFSLDSCQQPCYSFSSNLTLNFKNGQII